MSNNKYGATHHAYMENEKIRLTHEFTTIKLKTD